MMVKVCGVTNAEDALAAVEAGVSALGFNFWPDSPRYITAEAAAAIAAVLPASVIRVGVFVDETAANIEAIAAFRPLRRALCAGSADGAARGTVSRPTRVERARTPGVSTPNSTSCSATYAGRPTPLYAPSGSEQLGGARIYLKREDLLHTGAHKINNCLGQALLARRMGKRRIIAETGAGQHGVASATVCALFGFECVVYMGEEDMRRQRLNVFRMRLLGAKSWVS
jgi:hypothetical protein